MIIRGFTKLVDIEDNALLKTALQRKSLTSEKFFLHFDPVHIIERSNGAFKRSEFGIDTQQNQHNEEKS